MNVNCEWFETQLLGLNVVIYPCMSSSTSAKSFVNQMATETFTTVVSSSLPIFMSLSTSVALKLSNCKVKLIQNSQRNKLHTGHLPVGTTPVADLHPIAGLWSDLVDLGVILVHGEVSLIRSVRVDPCQNLYELKLTLFSRFPGSCSVPLSLPRIQVQRHAHLACALFRLPLEKETKQFEQC